MRACDLEEEKEKDFCDPQRLKMKEMFRSNVTLQELRLFWCLQDFLYHSMFTNLCNLWIVIPKNLDLNKAWWILSNCPSSCNVLIFCYALRFTLTSKSSEVLKRQKVAWTRWSSVIFYHETLTSHLQEGFIRSPSCSCDLHNDAVLWLIFLVVLFWTAEAHKGFASLNHRFMKK